MGVLCLVLVLLCSIICPFYFCNFLTKEERAGCFTLIEPVHEISNNVACATSKASDQPVHMRSQIRVFASCLSIL